MNLLKPSRQLTCLLVLFSIVITSLFSSCSKESDPEAIKVASGPLGTSFTSGTGGSGGSTGGGTTAGASTITFTISGKSYTLSSNSGGGTVNCSSAPASSGFPAITSLQGASADGKTTFSLYTDSNRSGTFVPSQFSITLPDGTLYTPVDNKASITYNTFSISSVFLVATKGTFTITASYGRLPDLQTTQITGSFDVK